MIVCRLPCEGDQEPGAVERLTELINRVYDEAESGMWRSRGARTSARQVEQLLRDQALILAEHEGTVVGSVNVNLLQDGVAEFGMLVADPARRSMGIGTALVQAAEDWARRRKCHTMRLELLTPRGWTHPSKELLREWYERSLETGSARPRIVGRGPTQ